MNTDQIAAPADTGGALVTEEEIEMLRRQHLRRVGVNRLCGMGCGRWPCPTLRALDSLAAAREEIQRHVDENDRRRLECREWSAQAARAERERDIARAESEQRLRRGIEIGRERDTATARAAGLERAVHVARTTLEPLADPHSYAHSGGVRVRLLDIARVALDQMDTALAPPRAGERA